MKNRNNFTNYAKIIADGGIAVFPTDTVVGLGCRFDSEDAISKIREIKGIKESSPLAVLISNTDQLAALKVRKNQLMRKLIEQFWPGGLTVVLTSENRYPCSGYGDTLGLRMPDVEELRTIIDLAEIPIVATSANLHGMPPPRTLENVAKEIIELADIVIDIPIKGVGQPSTVIKFDAGDIKILREGAILGSEIAEVIGGDY